MAHDVVEIVGDITDIEIIATGVESGDSSTCSSVTAGDGGAN